LPGDEVGIDSISEDLSSRMEKGVRKYGQPLRVFNNRDMLRDAYEEALDLVIYLKGVIMERDRSAPVQSDIQDTVDSICLELRTDFPSLSEHARNQIRNDVLQAIRINLSEDL